MESGNFIDMQIYDTKDFDGKLQKRNSLICGDLLK